MLSQIAEKSQQKQTRIRKRCGDKDNINKIWREISESLQKEAVCVDNSFRRMFVYPELRRFKIIKRADKAYIIRAG